MATIWPRFSRMNLILRTNLIVSISIQIIVRAIASIFSSENMIVVAIFNSSTDLSIQVQNCAAEMLLRGAREKALVL